MTRQEQIQRESEVYAWTANQFDIQLAFKKGVEWADKNPQLSKEQVIDEACEWLRNNIDFYVETNYGEDFRVDIEQLLKDIRKAMEE